MLLDYWTQNQKQRLPLSPNKSSAQCPHSLPAALTWHSLTCTSQQPWGRHDSPDFYRWGHWPTQDGHSLREAQVTSRGEEGCEPRSAHSQSQAFSTTWRLFIIISQPRPPKRRYKLLRPMQQGLLLDKYNLLGTCPREWKCYWNQSILPHFVHCCYGARDLCGVCFSFPAVSLPMLYSDIAIEGRETVFLEKAQQCVSSSFHMVFGKFSPPIPPCALSPTPTKCRLNTLAAI